MPTNSKLEKLAWLFAAAGFRGYFSSHTAEFGYQYSRNYQHPSQPLFSRQILAEQQVGKKHGKKWFKAENHCHAIGGRILLRFVLAIIGECGGQRACDKKIEGKRGVPGQKRRFKHGNKTGA